jgi:hypothetical protein
VTGSRPVSEQGRPTVEQEPPTGLHSLNGFRLPHAG